MKEIKLKAFAHVDFRKSEKTNFEEFLKTQYGSTIRKGEGVLFISMSDDQYVFVEPADEFDAVNGKGVKVRVQVLSSRRFRIKGSKWSPLMLSIYAEKAGLRISGIKRFEWYFKEHLLELKKAA